MSPDVAVVGSLVASRRGDPRPAFVEGVTGRSLTWDQVADAAEEWAAAGLPPGTRIGLQVADPLAMVPAFLGAVAAGLTVAPLDPDGTPADIAARGRALGLAAVVRGDGRPPRAWAPGEPGRGAALVLASSGTTGQPKLIPLTASQLLHTASSVVASHGLSAGEVGYSPLPLFHINGLVVGVLAALVGGHRLVVERRFSASAFWEVAAREEATWVNLVPAILAVLASRPAPAPAVRARVRFARSASAPLPVPTRRRFEQLTGIPVVETYGMTEAASQITSNPLPPGVRKEGSVGRPVGLELRVVERRGRAGMVAAGEIGEVEIRGPSVVARYWEPAGSAEPWRPVNSDDGWLPTGDLGFLDDDGYLFLVGRVDDVINRGGEKVYPREVEEVLLAHPGVAHAAVVGRPHPTVGEEPVAFVVPDDAADRSRLAAELAERCAEQLSRFRRPAAIEVVDELPSGTNGKIRRAELRRRLAAAAAGGAA